METDGGGAEQGAAEALAIVDQARADQLRTLRGPHWVTVLLIVALGVVVASWTAPFPEARTVGTAVMLLGVGTQLVMNRRRALRRIHLPGPYLAKVRSIGFVIALVLGGALLAGHVLVWGALPQAWLINGVVAIVLGLALWAYGLRLEERAFAATAAAPSAD